MILQTKELREIKHSSYDSSKIKSIINKSIFNIPRSDEEVLYIIECVLALSLEKLATDNLVVGICDGEVDFTKVKFAGFASNKYYDGKDYIHINTKKGIKYGNYVSFIDSLSTIGHEVEHIRQGRELRSVFITPFKIFTFVEGLVLNYYYEHYLQHHDDFLIEKVADYHGGIVIQKLYRRYLNKDVEIEEIERKTRRNGQNTFEMNKMIDKFNEYMRFIRIISEYHYNNMLKEYSLNDILPSKPGTLYDSKYYLKLRNAVYDKREKETYKFLSEVSKTWDDGTQSKVINSRLSKIILDSFRASNKKVIS